jgi:hypothetical protein
MEGMVVESRTFDDLTRYLATAATRRAALRAGVGSVLGSVLALGAGGPLATVRRQQVGSSAEERAAVIASAKER